MKARMVVLLLLWLVVSAVAASAAAAQSVLARTPNVSGGWVGAPNSIYFNFLHRFSAGAAPLRQVTNYPTFLLAYRAPLPLLLGAHYATRSDIVARYPNEWELFGRYSALSSPRLADASVQLGYNVAAESVDGELSLGRAFGRVRALAAARVFGNAYGSDATRIAIAGGATLALTESIAVAADVAQVFDDGDTLTAAWGAALQVAIPFTPHTLSLQATNTNTASLQGASRGADDVRWGFEFTIPLTLSRYFGRRAEPLAPPVLDPAAPLVQPARMRDLRYVPATIEITAGTTVIWTNDDDVVHTVTARDRSWNSGLIRPGETWRHTFTTPGTHDFFCIPHPQMTGTVIVRAQP